MNSVDTAAAEKALLLVTLGFLEALRMGAIDSDEAFHTIGIPSIVTRMSQAGISDQVADLVGQLDEFHTLGAIAGVAARDASIREARDECLALLKCMPPGPTSAKPVLKLLT
jgi:hypothetical protein